METWTEMINKQIGSEIWQLEMLCRNVIESLPIVVLYAVPIILCVVWFLVALDRMLTEDKDIPQSFDQHKAIEQHHKSARDRSSNLPQDFYINTAMQIPGFHADCGLKAL